MTTNPNVFESTHFATTSTNTVFTGSGVLRAIVVNTTAAGAITVKDGTTTKAILKSSVVEGTYLYEIIIANGLSVTLAAASDVTVTWAQG